MLGEVRLLTIDLDDTLWPCKPTIMAAEQWLYEWLKQQAPALAAAHTIDTLRKHRRQLAQEEPEIAHDMTLLRQRHLQILLQEHHYDLSIADEAVVLFQQQRNLVTPYADAIPALRRLREHFILVSVTNGNAEVEKTPLAGLFHHNLGASDVGYAKPHPAMFDHALELCGCGAEESAHIGDDPVRDIAAAREQGMGTIWVNRGGAEWPDDLPQPDLIVETISALVDMRSEKPLPG